MSGGTDLPYYNGHPTEISAFGWLALVGSVVVAYLLLILLPLQTFPSSLLPPVIFAGLPLLALAWASGGNHKALFGSFGPRELALAIGFGLLTILASFAVGWILIQVAPMATNPIETALVNIGLFDVAIFMLRTAIQLLGEELLTILPLLAVLWLCVRKLGMSRSAGLVVAVAVSTAWFSAVHLPTYQWNFLQCFAGIGTARLVLTVAFLVTRNIWVSTGAHIVNDWTEFLLPTLLAAGHAPIETAT